MSAVPIPCRRCDSTTYHPSKYGIGVTVASSTWSCLIETSAKPTGSPRTQASATIPELASSCSISSRCRSSEHRGQSCPRSVAHSARSSGLREPYHPLRFVLSSTHALAEWYEKANLRFIRSLPLTFRGRSRTASIYQNSPGFPLRILGSANREEPWEAHCGSRAEVAWRGRNPLRGRRKAPEKKWETGALSTSCG